MSEKDWIDWCNDSVEFEGKTKSDIRIQVRKEELKRGHRSISSSKVKET